MINPTSKIYRCLRFAAAMLTCLMLSDDQALAQPIAIWPDLAPGETSRESGTALPTRPDEKVPVTRVENISTPTMDVYPPTEPNGTAILVLPGGGFRYVVPDLEGSELAPILNQVGVTVFVLRYRVSGDSSENAWRKPVQDSQRALRWIRANAAQFQLDPTRIGLLGFSAGGQVAAWHVSEQSNASYERQDPVDDQPLRPDFVVFVYPWKLLATAAGPAGANGRSGKGELKMKLPATAPKSLLIGTSDDAGADPRGVAQLYLDLINQRVDAELHIYRTGGHGYGVRKRDGSVIHHWPAVLVEWLRVQNLLATK
ncbi:MAG: alpha/beta hydrolase [Planctomycetaceae bacterium]